MPAFETGPEGKTDVKEHFSWRQKLTPMFITCVKLIINDPFIVIEAYACTSLIHSASFYLHAYVYISKRPDAMDNWREKVNRWSSNFKCNNMHV